MTDSNAPISQKRSFSFDACFGRHLNLASSVSEEGKGYRFCANLFDDPNLKDRFGLGVDVIFDTMSGGDFHEPSDRFRILLNFSHGSKSNTAGGQMGEIHLQRISSQNRHLGFEMIEGSEALVAGSDLLSETYAYRSSGRFSVAARLHAGTLSSIPFDSENEELYPLASLRIGVDVRLMLGDTANAIPQEEITSHEVGYLILSNLHRLLQTYGTAKTFGDSSALATEYSGALFGNTANSSERLKDAGILSAAGILGAQSAEATDLKGELRADGESLNWLIGAKVATTLAYLALSGGDDSQTLLTQGLASSLTLAWLGLAHNLDLDLKSVRSMNPRKREESTRDFLLYRALISGGLLLAGWKADSTPLTQTANQSLLSTANLPDPADIGLASSQSHHLVLEHQPEGGDYIGYQGRTHLTSLNLYTETRILGQAVPGPDSIQDDIIDPATGRDARREGAKAKTFAEVGAEWENSLPGFGTLGFGIGTGMSLHFGGEGAPKPGVGLHEQILLSWGDESRFELGVGFSEDYVGGEMELGISPFLGWRSPL